MLEKIINSIVENKADIKPRKALYLFVVVIACTVNPPNITAVANNDFKIDN